MRTSGTKEQLSQQESCSSWWSKATSNIAIAAKFCNKSMHTEDAIDSEPENVGNARWRILSQVLPTKFSTTENITPPILVDRIPLSHHGRDSQCLSLLLPHSLTGTWKPYKSLHQSANVKRDAIAIWRSSIVRSATLKVRSGTIRIHKYLRRYTELLRDCLESSRICLFCKCKSQMNSKKISANMWILTIVTNGLEELSIMGICCSSAFLSPSWLKFSKKAFRLIAFQIPNAPLFDLSPPTFCRNPLAQIWLSWNLQQPH